MAAGALLLPGGWSFSGELLAAAIAFAVANGYFVYQAALLRARFADRDYGRLVLTKNVLALALTAGVAWASGSALATLAGACLGLVGATLALRKQTREPPDAAATGPGTAIAQHLAYGLPLCLSSLLYLAIPLADRWFASRWFGFAESGQLALAQDVGLRLVLSIGTAMDVLLFQFAVRAEKLQGAPGAHAQISRNMGAIFATTLPAVAGVWLVLPSFEALIVPADFRGPFAHYFTLLLPGLFVFGLTSFALAPAFQIARRTWPVSAAAAAAMAINLALALGLPRGLDASALALAQTAAYLAGFCTLLALCALARPRAPRLRDIAGATAATAAMCLATLPLRAWDPGLSTLLTQAAAGMLIYGGLALAWNVGDLRSMAWQALAARRSNRPGRQTRREGTS
jgi:O-antigen/teichoic acid export membrane protein